MALNTTYQYEQPKIPSGWLKDDETRRFYNRLIEVLDDIYLKYGRFDVKMFSESGLKSVIDATETTMASEIESSTVTTNVLKAALAEMIAGKIGTARIDYAQITDMYANRVFTDSEVAGKIKANSLQIASAQIVDLIVNAFRLVNSEGQVYKVTINQQGELLTERDEDEDADFADGKIPTGYSAVASSLTVGDVTSANLYVTGAADVMKLTAKYLSADNAFIDELVSNTAFVTYLMANKAFVDALYTSKIYGGKSIILMAEDTANAQSTADSATTAASKAQTTANSASTAASNAQTSADNAASAAATAQSTADDANTAASNAQTTADAANTAAGNAQSTADAASTAASKAQSTADTAKSNAAAAQSTADTAKTNAATAQSTADSAASAASKAQDTADSATTTANNAKSAADTATSTANTAKSTAESASTKATNAETTANTANTTANSAKTQADSAVSTANTANTTANAANTTANTAKDTADTAKSTANTAKTTADEAKALAFTASDTAPTSADTGYRWLDTGVTPQQMRTWRGLSATPSGADMTTDRSIDETVEAASGATATFDNTNNTITSDITVTATVAASETSWTPTQEGSGDPSPTNIRKIVGKDYAYVQQEDGTIVKAVFPETIYGGTVNADGTGTKTYGFVTLTGTETWWKNTYYYGVAITDSALAAEDGWTVGVAYGMCTHFGYNLYWHNSPYVCIESKTMCIGAKTTANYATVADWKAYIAAQYAAGTPVQVAYKLATPQTFTYTVETEYTETATVTVNGEAKEVTLTNGTGSMTLSAAEQTYTITADAAIKVEYTCSGWETVNDTGSLQSDVESVTAKAQDAYDRALDAQDGVTRIGNYVEIATDGLNVKSAADSTNYVNVNNTGVDIYVTGKKTSSFISKGLVLGNYILWQPEESGGLAFNLLSGGES